MFFPLGNYHKLENTKLEISFFFLLLGLYFPPTLVVSSSIITKEPAHRRDLFIYVLKKNERYV